jgi:hypothetical protein
MFVEIDALVDGLELFFTFALFVALALWDRNVAIAGLMYYVCLVWWVGGGFLF